MQEGLGCISSGLCRAYVGELHRGIEPSHQEKSMFGSVLGAPV